MLAEVKHALSFFVRYYQRTTKRAMSSLIQAFIHCRLDYYNAILTVAIDATIDVTIQTGLPPVTDHIVKRRNAIFGHIARMPSNVPVHQALSCQVDLSLVRPPDRSWKRRPGRPPKRWLDQIRDDSQRPPADVWRDAVRRGHRGATQRSSTTTR